MLDAFLNAPLLFLVPVLLLAFLVWAPWSPKNFYLHQHDWEQLESSEPPPAGDETRVNSVSDKGVDLGIEAADHAE